MRAPPEPRRLRCGTCGIQSGQVVVPFTTRRETGITLRKVDKDEYRCQFCYAPPEGAEEQDGQPE